MSVVLQFHILIVNLLLEVVMELAYVAVIAIIQEITLHTVAVVVEAAVIRVRVGILVVEVGGDLCLVLLILLIIILAIIAKYLILRACGKHISISCY